MLRKQYVNVICYVEPMTEMKTVLNVTLYLHKYFFINILSINSDINALCR